MSVVAAAKPGRLAQAGQWMQRHGALIRGIQWVVVAVYAFLIIVPAVMPLPDDSAHLWSNLTLAAEFVFWGIWWPFVLLSMVMLGRVWCGALCPEGALAEFASTFGRGRAIPRWMRWGGWPFVAFGITTIYGQMVSVYQYPLAVLLVLGGSTAAAIVIGLLYGRENACGASTCARSMAYSDCSRGLRRCATRSTRTRGAARTRTANTGIESSRSTVRRSCRCET